MANTNSSGRVCVIGAGISGLVSAKVLKIDGFDVTIFEKADEIGGVWVPSRTYPGLATNAARETYCYSDHPYPETAAPFPTAGQVRAYLRSYAERFSLVQKIHLKTEVTHVARLDTNGPWAVTVSRAGGVETLEFDFVVICNGVFSKPRLPEIANLDRFEGAVLHSSHFTNPEQVDGKHVVVVGAGKSAADCAVWATRTGASSTILFRRPHWMLPRYAFGLINTEFVVTTRFTEAFMPYYKLTRAETLMHGGTRPLTRISDRVILNLIRLSLRIPPNLVPVIEPLSRAFEAGGLVSDFYKLIRKGSLGAKRGEIKRVVDGHTLELVSGETLKADVVIFATGWKQEIAFLDEAILRQVQRDGRFHLYRTILPPELQTLGFVGYNTSVSTQLTSEIAANWLSEVFLGRMDLPSSTKMDEDISSFLQWSDRETPGHPGGYFIGPLVSHHIDDLLRDMSLPTKRSNWISEYFLTRLPSRYATVTAERKHRAVNRNKPPAGESVAAGSLLVPREPPWAALSRCRQLR